MISHIADKIKQLLTQSAIIDILEKIERTEKIK